VSAEAAALRSARLPCDVERRGSLLLKQPCLRARIACVRVCLSVCLCFVFVCVCVHGNGCARVDI
jgi:hypothetical protein